MIPLDLKNQINTTLIDARAAIANFQTAGFDLVNYVPQGYVVFDVVAGVGTGTNPTLDVIFLHSSTNNVSNAVNLPLYTNNLAVTNIARVSNTNSLQQVIVDPRQANRYVFAQTNLTGTTPNVPMSITARMVKQGQP